MATVRSAAFAVAAVLVAAFACTAIAGVSAITTKPSGTAIIQTTLQVLPTDEAKRQQQPSFAARYWQKQRDTAPSAVTAYVGDEDDVDSTDPQPPHKLSTAQQEHILDDIRRHNQQQQWWTAPGSAGTVAPSPAVHTEGTFRDGDGKDDQGQVNDQLQQLLQINNVVAADDEVATADNQDDDRHGKQRSIGNGGGASGSGSGGWHPQPSQPYSRPLHPSSSPYVPPAPPAAVQQQSHHQQQYYPTTSVGPTVPHHRHHQQQVFVTTPPSSQSSSAAPVAPNGHHHDPQQYVQQLQHYPKQQQRPAAAVAASSISGLDGAELDPDIEQQIRQQLTAAVVGAGGGNYTILASPSGGGNLGSVIQAATGGQNTAPSRITGLASNDHVQYVKIGGGGGSAVTPLSLSRNRVQQPPVVDSSAAAAPASITANRNTIVKTVVVRQKPSSQPAAASPAAVAPLSTAGKVASQQTWSASEQQQLEQLARQVLPPGVAQYEIIRAGGIDGNGNNGVIGDPVAAATASTPDDPPQVPLGAPQPSVVGKKKPVTFVILEERPDGTVRVRGVEKKQHVVGGGGGGGGDEAADQPGPVATDDQQLQQLVDRLNRGELRLPGTGSSPSVSKINAADSATAASTTAATPLPAYVPTFATTASPSPPPKSNGGYGITKHRDSASSSAYFSTVTPQATSTSSTTQHQQQYQNFFLPTAAPTAAVSGTTTVGQQNRYHHQQHHQQQQQYYSTPAITTSASSSTPRPVNSTLSYHNNNNKGAKEGVFSGALRRRGYYAMAKYMRQAGVDSVLEETGPFTVFVPTDKAFRALLVQLGGPDRAEDKFRENPRLLIGLLLHHVVPGAFKAADLMAGDEMTGVSLAGTQLRANLYARQLYDNRWNDIEVLTVNGARVLDNVVPAASVTTDDGSSADDGGGSVGPMQQRRDMVLSSGGEGSGLGGAGENQQIMAIGHAVDRVLFPLPVGDVLATMRADRQRRYSVFLRAVDEYCSPSVRSMLTGSRTLTVFAPMDEAFRVRRGSGNHTISSGSIVDWLLRDDAAGTHKKRNRRRIADRFVLSHLVLAGPGDPPMYTAGLRFYQVRDTAYRLPDGESSAPADEESYDGTTADDGDHDRDDGFSTSQPVDGEKSRYYQLTVYKDSGKIRLNGGVAQVLVRNVPATNGVLHGLDSPLV